MTKAGIVGICVIGGVTLLSRTVLAAFTSNLFGRHIVRPSPPRTLDDDPDLLARLLADEQHMADDRRAVALIRERTVGTCLIVFAASVLLILWSAFTALG